MTGGTSDRREPGQSSPAARPDFRGRFYEPQHPVTATYHAGLKLMAESRPADAVAILSTEPLTSPCYGLAAAQIALVSLVLGDHAGAIAAAHKALETFDANGCPFPPLAVVARRTIGDALSHSERTIQSLDHYFAALSLIDILTGEAPEFSDFLDQEKAITLTHLAGACNRLEQYQAALTYASTARPLYQKYPAAARLGLAFALENLAIAYGRLQRSDLAGYALEEALGLPDLSAEQRTRLELAKVQILRPPTKDARPVVQRAIDEAVAEQKWELAALRCGMGLIVALANDDAEWGQDLLGQAEAIEPRLPALSLSPARLQFYRAELLKRAGSSPEEIRKVLVIGAHHWCTRTGGRGELADYQFIAGQMADHFRLLARNCLDAGLKNEAFVAFEAGRARAVVAEMRNNLTHELVATSPFNEAGEIGLDFLRNIQGSLGANDVVVCFASVPPTTACFVVGRDTLDTVEVATPAEVEDELRLIPSRLGESKGLRAVPEVIQDLARKLVPLIAGRRVRALVPYRTFHLVPWRALLRQVGLGWDQLGFGVSFSPTLCVRHRIDPLTCCAIGHGAAGGIDLNEEAETFAAQFGAAGTATRNAARVDFRAALGQPAVTLISCHGHLVTGPLGPKVKFALADGPVTLEEVIPEQLRSPLVILSACDSGAYDTMAGDYPVGAAPTVVLRGSSYCACSRFPIRADFSRKYFPAFGRRIVGGILPEAALAETCAEFDTSEDVLWRDLACVELLIRGD